MLATTQSLVVAHGALSHFYYEKLSQKMFCIRIYQCSDKSDFDFDSNGAAALFNFVTDFF